MQSIANAKLFFLLLLSAPVLIVSHASPPPVRFHYINPHNFTASASPSASASASESALGSSTSSASYRAAHRSRNPSLSLMHRDAISGTTYPSPRHAVLGLVARDNVRVKYLAKRLASTYLPEDLGSEVVSGLDEGSGEYFVGVGVGSPPTEQYLVVDSGSDVIWVQCRPCEQCYPQTDPLFDPATSSSFSGVACGSAICRMLPRTGCSDAGKCNYEVSYGDGSYTKGVLALETLTFGGTAVQGVAIGCGHRNNGLFVGAAGLLGLGWGPMSIVGQLGGAAGGAFSYCLASRGPGSNAGAGSLVLGRSEAVPTGAVWVPLVRNNNNQASSFYYVGLAGIGVGGQRLPLQDGLFQLTEDGDGGVVMDTGTAVTRLPQEAYAALRDAFAGAVGDLPRAPAVSLLDTCYDLSGYTSVRVPTVSFYFDQGAVLTLPARNLLVETGDGVYCLAFAPSSSALSILGNIQQQGIQITIDSANGYVGFGPNTC